MIGDYYPFSITSQIMGYEDTCIGTSLLPIIQQPSIIFVKNTEESIILKRENEELKQKLKDKEGDYMKLYDVYLCYGENRDKPVVKRFDSVVAKDVESAKIKSGCMKEIDAKWKTDYITVIVKEIGEVAVSNI